MANLEIIGDEIICFAGDTLTVAIETDDELLYETIQKVLIISKELEIEEELIKMGDLLFSVDIAKEITAEYKPNIYSFDVEVHLPDQVLISDSPKRIKILRRFNKEV